MIKEMRSEDKPRERFAKAPDTASMVDLVAILLRTGRHGCSVMDMAQEVVEQPAYRLVVRETPRYRQVGNIIIVQ